MQTICTFSLNHKCANPRNKGYSLNLNFTGPAENAFHLSEDGIELAQKLEKLGHILAGKNMYIKRHNGTGAIVEERDFNDDGARLQTRYYTWMDCSNAPCFIRTVKAVSLISLLFSNKALMKIQARFAWNT